MNLSALDLNLLVALDALLREGHVGRAAARVGLSQPAMSHALSRLSDALSDPLLVRAGTGMRPTPRARTLRVPLTAALEQIRALFAPDTFEPSRSQRSFRLMMPDLVVDLLLSPLVRGIAADAPGVRLEVIPWRGAAVSTQSLARSTDLVIYCERDAFPGFRRQRVYQDHDVLAVSRGHPLGQKLRRMEAFLGARHVAVAGHGSREDMIDTWLRREGHRRRIAVVTPGYLQALHVAAQTDLVAFVPRRLVQSVVMTLGLQLVEPPLDPGIDEQFLSSLGGARRPGLDLASPAHPGHWGAARAGLTSIDGRRERARRFFAGCIGKKRSSCSPERQPLLYMACSGLRIRGSHGDGGVCGILAGRKSDEREDARTAKSARRGRL